MAPRILAGLTLLVMLSVLLSPLHRELFVGDETKYGQIIREMKASGSLLVPQLEGRAYSHKPPLHFWMIWALTFLFGTASIWPFVIPAMIGYAVLIWVSGILARDLFGGHEWLTRFILASFWLVWGLAQTARMDLEFTVAISIAALFSWRWLVTARRRFLLGAGIAVGIAILIKGPMALVIVLVLLGIQAFRRRSGWRREYAGALLIAAAIPLTWLIPATIAGGRDYSHELLVTQNLGRAVSSWTHSAPPWFYLAHYPVAFLPWSLLSIPALISLRRRRAPDRDAALFCLDWFLAVLIPFTLLSGKLDVYMVPAMVPISLLTARYLAADADDSVEQWGTRLSRILVVLIGALFLFAIVLGPQYLEAPERALLELPRVRALFWVTAAASAIGLVLQLRLRRPVPAAVVAALVSLAPLLYATTFLIPDANEQVSSAPLVREIAKETNSGSEVGLYGAPHLWSRDLPASLQDIRYLGAGALDPGSGIRPRVIAVRRDKAPELGSGLAEYRRVGHVVLKGKEFDVYRRN